MWCLCRDCIMGCCRFLLIFWLCLCVVLMCSWFVVLSGVSLVWCCCVVVFVCWCLCCCWGLCWCRCMILVIVCC